MNAKTYEILKRPLITEKSTVEKDLRNKLFFEVDRRANKIEIRDGWKKFSRSTSSVWPQWA